MATVGKANVNVADVARVAKLLRSRGVDARHALAGALHAEGEAIMRITKREFVPVDTGALRSTGHVQLPRFEGDRIVVELGYGGPAAPYAHAVHENPRAGKTGGVSPSGKRYKTWAKVGQWKYLEQPFEAARAGLPERLATRMKRRLRSTS